MDPWWAGLPDERYWCEITYRPDIGADLKCPQRDESGRAFWSYSLINSVWPGDVVLHYSGKLKAFVGASVAEQIFHPGSLGLPERCPLCEESVVAEYRRKSLSQGSRATDETT